MGKPSQKTRVLPHQFCRHGMQITGIPLRPDNFSAKWRLLEYPPRKSCDRGGAVDKIPFPPKLCYNKRERRWRNATQIPHSDHRGSHASGSLPAAAGAALDLSFVRVETAHLYSRRYGRPPIDGGAGEIPPGGLLYGIPSERQIEQRIQTDVALRWYLGLDLFDRVPDHSTISQLRRRKPSFRKIFRRLFEEVVGQCVAKGLASGRLVGTDSTM